MAISEDLTPLAKVGTALATSITNSIVDRTSSDSQPESTPRSTGIESLTKQVQKAKKEYGKLSRWMLGVFGGVGVLIFGSLPFSNVGKIEGDDRWRMATGLAAAALGIAMAVWATSMVAEPLDASLGALDRTLRHADKYPGLWPGPRIRCAKRLSEILSGQESQAHLGPDMASLSGLITNLGALEKKRLDMLELVMPARREHELVTEEIAACCHFLHDGQSAAQAINVEATQLLEYVQAEKATRGQRKREGELATIESELDLYQERRQILLLESAMMQMRGRFRLSRWMMTVGALITLGGGALYAVVLPSK